jgi:lysine/ornithine N-monooxygenase
MTKTKNRYEVRLHRRDNSEEFVFSSDDVVEATGHAKDCREFNPDGSLLVYDLVDNKIVEVF